MPAQMPHPKLLPIAVRELSGDNDKNVREENSPQSIPLESWPVAVNTFRPDWTIVALLPSDRKGDELSIITEDNSKMTLESVIVIEFVAGEPITLIRLPMAKYES
jgi:hypothetical protein